MSRSDYAHWNEEADRIWWEEEGKHQDNPNDDYDDHYEDYDEEEEE